MLLIRFLFVFNETSTTEIYTLSLHDALPICRGGERLRAGGARGRGRDARQARRDRHLLRELAGDGLAARDARRRLRRGRSEEHTSELQSQSNLVCRLLLEKNNTNIDSILLAK